MASSSNVSNSSPGETYACSAEFDVLDFVPKLSERNYKKWASLMRDFIDSQGLVGFIGGTAATAEESNQHDNMAWKISNNILVRRWILATLNEDTRIKVLSCKTAKDMWTRLRQIFDATGSSIVLQPGYEVDEKMENGPASYYAALHKAVLHGNWDRAVEIIQQDQNAVRISINPDSKTSASAGRDHFVDVVDLVDRIGAIALHSAAIGKNVAAATKLVEKNRDLPNVSGRDGLITPLHAAADTGSRDMVVYLKEVTADDLVDASLLGSLIWGELYDIALTLLQEKPELANSTQDNPLIAIAQKHSSFRSGNSLHFWERLIYSGVPMRLEGNNIANIQREAGGGTGDLENQVVTNCCISVRQRLYFMIWEVAEKLVPCIKRIREKKERHHHALELVKFLSSKVAESSLSTAQSIFKQALHHAARVEITEVIEEIIVSYPMALCIENGDHINLFKYAITHRRARVFNILYQVNPEWRYMALAHSSSNNVMHLTARLTRKQQINLKANAAGAILQMQREVQWFKEVEKFSLPRHREEWNADGMTPAEVFSDTHQYLVKEGERWMKDTGTSCTIVAALIATVAFAAAITIPGGNDTNNGHPLLSKQKAFVIFGVSDALALFSSITSVLTFLLILTSRYAEEDFLYTLPNRLIIGLITLFFSILSTMVAFGAILYLVFGNNTAWILIPVVALASIPVTLFGASQFPLLKEMIQSTYGRGIFGKQSNRVLI